MLSNFFKQVRDSEVGEDILGDVFRSIRERKIASELAIACLGMAEGRESKQSILELVERLNGEESNNPNSDDEFVTSDLTEILNDIHLTTGLRWRLNSLNQSLGSLRKGNFGFIFARPETGKTTFLASEVSYMAQQIPEGSGPVLWFNNEEVGKKVMSRVYQATLGVNKVQLISNSEANKQQYRDLINERIQLLDRAEITRNRVEQLCKKYQPSLVIFDQIDKIKGFAADREDLRLGAIYIWARELAKTYCPVIGVCQADGTGEGVRYLTMDHVSNAKTAKQAEADWILGIGCIHDPVYESVRFLHLSKNKLDGDADTDPKWRHRRWEVLIRPEIARYEDIQ